VQIRLAAEVARFGKTVRQLVFVITFHEAKQVGIRWPFEEKLTQLHDFVYRVRTFLCIYAALSDDMPAEAHAILVYRDGPANPEAHQDHHFAFGNRTPKTLFNLLMMAPFGMALPDSYSLMTVPFSLICVASAACVIFLASRACCRAILKS